MIKLKFIFQRVKTFVSDSILLRKKQSTNVEIRLPSHDLRLGEKNLLGRELDLWFVGRYVKHRALKQLEKIDDWLTELKKTFSREPI